METSSSSSRQRGSEPRPRETVLQALRQDRHDRRRSPVEHGRPETPDDPEEDPSLAQRAQVFDVLDEREPGSDREAEDGRVDEEPDPLPGEQFLIG